MQNLIKNLILLNFSSKGLDEFIMINSENNTSIQLGNISIPLEIPIITISDCGPNNSEINSFENLKFKSLYCGIAALFGILITLICIAIM
uniref:Recep_L_domain domain-containing protein n=1 Tax=Meloidogyne hapla TaxID=6305 RepID=A0A1I8B8W4_MELHA